MNDVTATNTDDIFDELESINNENKTMDDIKKTTASSKDKNPWDVDNITQYNLEVKKLKPAPKEYSIAIHIDDKTKDDEKKGVLESLTKIVTALSTKGYILRYSAGGNEDIMETLRNTEGVSYKTYLPWKNINKNIKNDIMTPTLTHLRIASNYYENFNAWKKQRQMSLGNDVSVLLDKDHNTPCKFVILYSHCGTAKLSAPGQGGSIDRCWKNIGIMKMANKFNIPLLNIQESDFKDKLIKHMN